MRRVVGAVVMTIWLAEAVAVAVGQVGRDARSSGALPALVTSMPRLASAEPEISLDFQHVDVREALRALAALADLSLVLDPTIEGPIDMTLEGVTWEQALDLVLRAHRLGVEREARVLRVAPLSVLASELTERRERVEAEQRERALLDKAFRTITLSYARAESVAALVEKVALTPFGEVEIDEPTNTVILTDLPEGLDRAAELVRALDRAQPQVEIQSRIVQTTRDFTRELGVRLGLFAEASSRLGNTWPWRFPNTAVLSGRLGGEPRQGQDTAELSLSSVAGAVRLDLALSALERQGKARVLSAPRVTTQNNVEAEVQQGTQIPYVTQATPVPGGADAAGAFAALQPPTVQFKDASLKLKVTPQITAADTIVMRVELERSAPDFASVVPGNPNPPISTSKAISTVQVADEETLVIGGVMVRAETEVQRRTPWVHRVPLLGWLFRERLQDRADQELVLFITPRILRGAAGDAPTRLDEKE